MSTINATTNLYIRQKPDSTSDIQYSNNNQEPWVVISFPATIINTNTSSALTVRFETDLTITTNKYFEIGSDNIIIDGNSKNVTITGVTEYPGLIQNGTSDTTNGKHDITVKNINTRSSGSSTLANYGGWICQSYFGKGALNNMIENCSNAGAVNANSAGGICGSNAGYKGNCTLLNCSNKGVVNAVYAGGICGSSAGFNSGNCTLTNCSNEGDVIGNDAGGICGLQAGANNGICTLTNCSNTGDVIGNDAGGICGSGVGGVGTCTLTNCYNTGAISGEDAGGICGSSAGNYGACIITNCYNTGVVGGVNAGGICGADAGQDLFGGGGTCTITNCYNIGAVNGNNAGGICGMGAGANNGTCTLTNCYNTGVINASNAGGICGSNAGANNGTCTLTNCSNTGVVNASNAGGICGYAAGNNGNCSLTDCSNEGAVSGESAGGICGSNAGKNGTCTLTNCYNTGVVNASNAGGICGSQAGFGGTCTLTNCSNEGVVSGTGSGGICGYGAGSNGNCTITNCYNTGAVSGDFTGGICGYGAGDNNGKCLLTNCYTLYNSLSTTTVSSNTTTGFVIFNCYTAGGTWSDSVANIALFGSELISLPSPWFSVSSNTPYILSSFNREIYSVMSITGSVPFSSLAGLFVSPDSEGVVYNYKLIGPSPVGVTINANTGVIDFGVSMSNGPYALNVVVYKESSGIYYDYNFNNLTVEIVAPPPSPPSPPSPISNICFPAGTPISCNEGVIAIENLNLNIHTIRNKKIVGITKTISQDNFLVCFEKNALGSNVPCAKTIISKNHSIFYDGKMLKAKGFIEMNDKVYKVKYKGEVLYNVLMESHDKMVVNNLICETLDPKNCVAKLYKILQGLSLNEQSDLINAYNDVVIKHKIYR